mgnify:FL=1|jgi:hypothetical protein
MTPISITNLVYSREDKTAIDCNVVFLELASRFPDGMPYTASVDDVEEHTRKIYSDAIAGVYGPIADWVPPSLEELSALARAQRDSRLVELDSIVMNPLRYASFSEEYKTALATYRQALLDVPEQDGFPYTFILPEFPQP